jgi:peptide maturation system acyl carrier-related protein
MHNPEVAAKLKELFKSRFNIDMRAVSGEFYDKHLLGRDIGMKARDLLYAYFDIKKEFGINIPEEEIAAGKFNTFNNMVEIISNQLEKENKEDKEAVNF